MAKKKVEQKESQEPTNTPSSTEEFVVLGHLIKYNLYLLAKSVIFSAVVSKSTNVDEAVELTNKVISELDLDSKRRAEAANAN